MLINQKCSNSEQQSNTKLKTFLVVFHYKVLYVFYELPVSSGDYLQHFIENIRDLTMKQKQNDEI